MPSGGLHHKEWQLDWHIQVAMERVRSTPHGSAARLRVVLCTCGGFCGALMLRRLRACARLNICAVVRSTRVLSPKAGFLSGALAYDRRSALAYAMYLWYATTASERLCALEGIETVPTRETASGVTVYSTRNLNRADRLRILAARAADLLFGAFFNLRLHPAALALAKLVCLHVHHSLLSGTKRVEPVLRLLLQDPLPFVATVHIRDASAVTGTLFLDDRRLLF